MLFSIVVFPCHLAVNISASFTLNAQLVFLHNEIYIYMLFKRINGYPKKAVLVFAYL